nr:immunoglobulin heavy chain junction region [Mus musculus]MBK4198422.1 immunoglobulin heavy chain junction region [Mus musculus]MBK4198423.1 immunoglobulin heavy chain junction region [Mus musculus]MBK4198424.1 immunoglobulin heavy chain junction region [Mus musculus]
CARSRNYYFDYW